MNIAFILAILGSTGYMINLRIIDRYMKIKAYQIQEQGKAGRRRSSENREVKNKNRDRLMKEVPKLKWTLWFGFACAITFIVGIVWMLIDLIRYLFKI